MNFISDNYEYMYDMSDKHSSTSALWLSVKGFLEQLQGLLNGLYTSNCLLPKDRGVYSNDKKQQKNNFPIKTFKIDPAMLKDTSLLKSPDSFSLLHLLLMNAWGDLNTIMSKFDIETNRADIMSIPEQHLVTNYTSMEAPTRFMNKRNLYPGSIEIITIHYSLFIMI